MRVIEQRDLSGESRQIEQATSLGAPDLLGFRLRHLGAAVPELEPAALALETLFGYKVVAGPFDDAVQKVRVAFLRQSGADSVDLELIAPLSEDSPIRALLTKNVGAYHFCFETSNLDGALDHARNQGCVVVSGPVPAVAFEGRRIAWIYSPSRQLFELLESSSAG